MKKVFIFIFSIICIVMVSSQTLRITKIEVNEDGSVLLQWQYSGDEASFDRYVVERFEGTAYQQVASLPDMTANFYTDRTTDATLGATKYRIVARTTNLISSGDSITTIYLNLANISDLSVTAFLIWNNPFIGSLRYNDYYIYRKIQNKTDWIRIGSTSSLMYRDTVLQSICSDTILYKIMCKNDTVKTVVSNKEASLFMDLAPTSPCKLDVVTIDEATQKIHLSWEPSPDPDIMGYFICQGSPCVGLDTVWGKYNTNYTARNHSSTSVHDYRIYAFDSCFTASALTDFYHNMVITGNTVNCEKKIQLEWNAYINMPDAISHYIVYARYNNEPNYRTIEIVPANNFLRSVFTVPDDVSDVYAKIIAVNTTQIKQSESNTIRINLSTPDTAKYIYIRSASIDEGNSRIEFVFHVDSLFQTDYYLLYRKTNRGSFTLYKKIPYIGLQTMYYQDMEVDLSLNKYTYYLAVKDACGLIEKKSNITSPVYLALKTENTTNRIIRTDYVGWNAVERYEVYRRQIHALYWDKIGTMQPFEREFTDDMIDIPHLRENLLYKVVAFEAENSEFNFHDTSSSQRVIYTRKGDLWLPNAFTPRGGNNNLFSPSYTFMQSENYLFQIYNRMGVLVFETTNPDSAWNGTYKGSIVAQGSYVYIIYCTFSDGTKHVQKGTVLVLH